MLGVLTWIWNGSALRRFLAPSCLPWWACFLIIDKITPVDMWAEIVEKQNLALGVVVAAMCLGISIIVAAAIG